MKEMPSCPVCGMDADVGNHHTEYYGFSYYFCSSTCQQVFSLDPDTYLGMQMQRFHDRSLELELVRKETLECLSRAAEFKDNETGRHTSRIAAYSHRLSLLAGLSPDHAARIRETAPMHDVGKIGIPDHILLKRGGLNTAERKLIEQHPEMGIRILGTNLRSEIMQIASTITITHHEKWDGSGYPYGLREEAIPVEGRIVAICDVFDALISERPYKSAWPVKKVRTCIDSEQGSHFDPALASLFVQHFSDFVEIHDQFRDIAHANG